MIIIAFLKWKNDAFSAFFVHSIASFSIQGSMQGKLSNPLRVAEFSLHEDSHQHEVDKLRNYSASVLGLQHSYFPFRSNLR